MFGDFHCLPPEKSENMIKKIRQKAIKETLEELTEKIEKLKKYCEDCKGNTIWLDEVLKLLKEKSLP